MKILTLILVKNIKEILNMFVTDLSFSLFMVTTSENSLKVARVSTITTSSVSGDDALLHYLACERAESTDWNILSF